MSSVKTRLFVDGNVHFISLDKSGTNTNVITIGRFNYAKVSDNSTVLNEVTLSLQGTEFTQILAADLDVVLNIGSFAYVTTTSGSTVTTTIKIAVSKTTITTIEKAKEYVTGLELTYLNSDLSYAADTVSKYILKTYLPNGDCVASSDPITWDEVSQKIQVYDVKQGLNTVGHYIHEITRSMVVS